MSHTPGPWLFGHLGTESFWVGPDFDQTPVARVDHDTEDARDNSRANACLLAAAPDLLTALEAIVSAETHPLHVDYDHRGNYVWADTVRTDGAEFAAARAAIAKAKGSAA